MGYMKETNNEMDKCKLSLNASEFICKVLIDFV